MRRPLPWLIGSNVTANLADGFLSLAVPLLAIRLTDDPLVISLASVASMLPWMLFSVPVGAVLDRVDRAKALAMANVVRACCLLALTIAVGTGTISIVALYCVVVALGVFELVTDNAASSLVPAAAGRQELDRANSWVQGGQLVAQNFVAVPLAAALFAAVAWGPFFVASSAYTLAAAAANV